jgi:hypothetical protein
VELFPVALLPERQQLITQSFTFGSMKVPMRYVNDADGNVQAVQIPVEDWNDLVEKVRHYEQLLKLRSTLSTALTQVARMRSGKLKKRTLKDALREA